MSNEIIRYSAGERLPVSREDRQSARRRQLMLSEGREVARMVDVVMAVAAHTMEQAVELDKHREHLAQGDPLRNMIMADFEETAFQQARAIQRGLFNEMR